MMSKKSIDLVGPWFVDESINGISDEFFDNVIKHIDFPLEDVEGNVLAEDWDAGFQLLELPSSDVLAGFSSSFYGKICNDKSGAANDAPEYEEKHKVNGLLGDAKPPLNGDILIHGTFGGQDSSLFHSSSSVSVLESNSSCSAENLMPLASRIFIPVKRPRSKRLRPTTFNQRLILPFMSSSGSAPRAHSCVTAYESCSGSNTDEQMAESGKRRGKKRNLSVLSDTMGMNDHLQQPVAIRKCMHCEVTKTPQWREGPLGPKTLCNACGVRYRSGRLFPEYRPAASPTFVTSLHSNSHRKVIEMRKKANREGALNGMNALRPVQLGNSSGFLPI